MFESTKLHRFNWDTDFDTLCIFQLASTVSRAFLDHCTKLQRLSSETDLPGWWWRNGDIVEFLCTSFLFCFCFSGSFICFCSCMSLPYLSVICLGRVTVKNNPNSDLDRTKQNILSVNAFTFFLICDVHPDHLKWLLLGRKVLMHDCRALNSSTCWGQETFKRASIVGRAKTPPLPSLRWKQRLCSDPSDLQHHFEWTWFTSRWE